MTQESFKWFCSYAREDAEFVMELAKELREVGASLWLDQMDIVAGSRWDESVEGALVSCEGMLAVLSPSSVASQNFMDEVSYALQENKQVIPVLYRECAIPFRLQRVQRVDLTGDYDKGFADLSRALGLENPAPAPAALVREGREKKRHEQLDAEAQERSKREATTHGLPQIETPGSRSSRIVEDGQTKTLQEGVCGSLDHRRRAAILAVSVVAASIGGVYAWQHCGPKESAPAEAPQQVNASEEAVAQVSPPADIPPPPDVGAPPENAERSASGLAWTVLKEGTGDRHPAESDVVTVNYTGWTTEGRIFDSSIKLGAPPKFPLNRVLLGFSEGVQLMVVGEKRRLWVPQELAYQGKAKMPEGMVVFDIELLEIEEKY